MQAIASSTAVRPQFAGAKKSFAAKKVRAPASDARGAFAGTHRFPTAFVRANPRDAPRRRPRAVAR
jgi:hypothetical protein